MMNRMSRSRLAGWASVLALGLILIYGVFMAATVSGRGTEHGRGAQTAAGGDRRFAVDAQLDDSRWLLLKYAEFDPLVSEPASLRIGDRELQSTSMRDIRAKRAQAAGGEGHSY